MKRQKSGSTSAMEKEPGFGHMWQNPKFQDMVIRLLPVASQPAPATLTEEQEPSEGPSKRQKTNPEVLQDIAANKAVLASSSNYWVTRIDRWDQQADSTKSLKLDEGRSLAVFEESIEPQDLPMVQAAVHFAYTRQPPSGIAELMQAVRLADKWAMPGYMAACLRMLARADDAALTARDINLIMADDLPPGVLQHPGYAAVKQTCAKALVRLFAKPQQLCNSEDKQKWAAFRGLSFMALLLWAQQDDLQVDSENTVVVLITKWWQRNMPKTQGVSEQARQQRKEQLSSALRVQHLTASFFVDVLRRLPWFTSKHAPKGFSLVQMSRQLQYKINNTQTVTRQYPPDWLKDPRISADQVFMYEWEVTTAQLEQLHEDAGNASTDLRAPKPFFWKGVWWQLGLRLGSHSDPLYLTVEAWTKAVVPMRCPTVMSIHLDVRFMDGARTAAISRIGALFGQGCKLEHEWELFAIPATAEPRPSSLPGPWLMADDKLHLQVVMKEMDAPARTEEASDEETDEITDDVLDEQDSQDESSDWSQDESDDE